MVAMLAGCGREDITITSTPPEATVWTGDDQILGPTPLTITRLSDGDRVLRVSKPSYDDATIDLSASSPPPGGMLHTKLTKRANLGIDCRTSPSGADVFLDGECQGKTPLDLRGLEPRIYELAFRLKARQQALRTVDLSEADATLVVHAELGSLTEVYYLQQIEKSPDSIHHYADLGHHYMLENRFPDATATFSKGINVVVQHPDVSDSSRLWSEIQRAIEEQYEYGDASAVKEAREILADSLGKDVKTHSGQEPLMLLVSYAIALDTLDRRQQAQEVFDVAWRKFPGDKTLSRIRKQRRFAIP